MLAGTHDTMDDPTAEDAEELSFWQRPLAQNILPFLTSILLHASIITIGILTATVIRTVFTHPVVVQIRPPEPITLPVDDPTAVPHPGIGARPDLDAGQMDFPSAIPTGISESLKVSSDLPGGGSGESVQGDLLIGVGPRKGIGQGPDGVGPGRGPGNGPGTDAGLGMAPFGPAGGGGIGPRGTFGGIPVGLRDVIFVMDASGSMMEKFDSLRSELRKAINSLRPPQSFNVIFFQANGIGEAGKQLLFATPANKRKAMDFMDATVPTSETHPEAALEAAFAQHPQVIFLLTDGDFPDNKSVVDIIHRLDANKTVRVNTIAFLDRGEEYEKVLKQIAADTGGTFRYVSEAELSQP